MSVSHFSFAPLNDITDNLAVSHHALGSHTAILLSRWLGESDTEQMASIISSGPVSMSDWILLAFSQMGGQAQTNRVAETFVQKLLEMGDIHTSATILLGMGDNNDAIEVYVSRHHYLEAILLTCLLMPTDWQRQSYLVRRWGEHVVSHSQQQLAIRCFMCTGVEPSEPWTSPAAQQAASFAEMMHRRSPMGSPEPQYSNPASVLPSSSRPKSGSGNRGTAKTPALKLITSFENQPNQRFRFPGLKSDDRTPTNAPGVTPIAESAVGESALSPGGLGSYRLNNIQSLNHAMGSRSGTPAYSRGRLPSIGETPVDVQPPAFSSKSSQDIAVTSDTDDSRQEEKDSQNGEDPFVLLPSVRYDPEHKPSPQTAVQGTADQFASIKGLPSPSPGVFEALKEKERRRSHSRSISSDKGLQIHLIQPESSQPGAQDEPEMLSSARSAASTLNSFSSARSPSVSGRSIDQYISSLGEANYHTKYRDRKHGRSRRNTDDTASQGTRRQRSRNTSENRGRNGNKHVPSAEQSLSSEEELAGYNTRTPNQDGTGKSRHGGSRIRKGSSRTSSERRRNRSTSRNTASRVGHKNDASVRGRSMDRSGSKVRSPSSPAVATPNGDSSQMNANEEDPLRLVAGDRERLRSRQRSSSRRAENGVPQGEPSPQPKHLGARSRSHQNLHSDGQASYDSIQATNGVQWEGKSLEPSAMSPEMTQSAYANAPFVSLAERKRKELAAAELEARRLSLARNPSAPNIPLPGQVQRPPSPLASPPFIRSPNQHKSRIPPSKASPEYPSSSDSSSSRAGVPIGLPATPRSMRYPKYRNGQDERAPSVPSIPDSYVFANDGRYQVEEPISRSMSVPAPEPLPAVPADLPMHPRFNPHLPSSRSTSKTRTGGHRRNSSRELSTTSGEFNYGSSPVTVNIEENIENALQKKQNEIPPPPPPILPELQHLYTPPPPPPVPDSNSTTTESPRQSSGMIDIAIDNENMGRLLPRAMTAAPALSTIDSKPGHEKRRLSLDHRRNRSINESFSNKIRNLARMRSNSRNGGTNGNGSAWGRGYEGEFPYESVQVGDGQF